MCKSHNSQNEHNKEEIGGENFNKAERNFMFDEAERYTPINNQTPLTFLWSDKWENALCRHCWDITNRGNGRCHTLKSIQLFYARVATMTIFGGSTVCRNKLHCRAQKMGTCRWQGNYGLRLQLTHDSTVSLFRVLIHFTESTGQSDSLNWTRKSIC